MNKLHDALKNEELMLEVGRKATEEQLNEIEIAGVKLKTGKTLECDTQQCKEYVRLAQQSTVEERFTKFSKDEYIDSLESGNFEKIVGFIQLAEQKAREEERYRIASIIDWYFEGLIIIQEPKLTKQNLINTITKE